MLRISQQTNLDQTENFICVDQRRKQVTLIPPKKASASSISKFNAGMENNAPKMFAFDGIFEADATQVFLRIFDFVRDQTFYLCFSIVSFLLGLLPMA